MHYARKVILSWFHEYDNKFNVNKWLPQCPDLNPVPLGALLVCGTTWNSLHKQTTDDSAAPGYVPGLCGCWITNRN